MSDAAAREPTVVLGPLALIAIAAFWRDRSGNAPVMTLVGIAAGVAELAWPPYRRFKRHPRVPTIVAYYPDV